MDIEPRGEDKITERKVVRRGLLTGLAALGAAAMVKLLGTDKAHALDPDDLTLAALNNVATNNTTQLTAAVTNVPAFKVIAGGTFNPGKSAIVGVTDASGGAGVWGSNDSTTGYGVSGETAGGTGVRGNATSSFGTGVLGIGVIGSSFAMRAIATTNGTALKALSNAANSLTADGDGAGVAIIAKSGSGNAINATSTSGKGIDATSSTSYAIDARSTSGEAVIRAEGAGAKGIIARSTGNEAIFAEATGANANAAIRARSVGPSAIFGINISGVSAGVRGYSNADGDGNGLGTGAGPGVHGRSGTGPGVHGQSTSGAGVYGISVNQPGIDGVSTNSLGVRGISTNFTAMVGISTNGHGLYGSTSNAASAGFVGENLAGGLAGYFAGNVFVTGALQVVGAKNAVITMQDGTMASVYCQESPEPYFEDFGRGQLTGGVANVTLEREFAGLVGGADYMVFLTPAGDTRGLYVSRQGPAGFEVREAQGGASSAGFTYRLVTKRRDIEGRRFARVSDNVGKSLAASRAAMGITGAPPVNPTPPQNPAMPFVPQPDPPVPLPNFPSSAPNPPSGGPSQPGPSGIIPPIR